MALERETLLDIWDNLTDVLRFGKWWQRLIVIGIPLSVVFAIFWFRPLPPEINDKLVYLDESSNNLYADGAASILDEYYEYVSLEGEETTWMRSTWKEKLKDRFADYQRRGWSVRQETTSESFYWKGISSLVQTVIIHRQQYDRGQLFKETRYRVIYTWSKTDHGWYVTRAQVLPRVKSDE